MMIADSITGIAIGTGDNIDEQLVRQGAESDRREAETGAVSRRRHQA